MPDLTAKRTLVKSPPELWSELSEVERLARHLGAFGEIKITKLEPEHTVAWEGASASGTVSIEPSGWGTKVMLTAQLRDSESLPASGAGVEDPPATETAAGEGERDLPGGGEERVAEGPVEAGPVDEAPVVEYLFADEPEAAQPVADEPEPEEPVASESECEEPVADEPESGQPVPDEPDSEESAVEEMRVAPPVAEPIQAKPRRKRGFLAWLFRPRTTAHGSAPTVATPSAATPSEPVGQRPVVEEPVVGEAQVVDATPVVQETLVEGETAPVEEPPVAAEAPVVEEASVVDEGPTDGEDPVLGDAPAEEASAPDEPLSPELPPSSEAPPSAEEPRSSDEPRVMLLGGPGRDQRPPSSEPLARVEHEAPAVDGHRMAAEESPESEGPAVAELVAPADSSPHPGLDPERAQAILDEALDTLGSAHHRPFSRG